MKKDTKVFYLNIMCTLLAFGTNVIINFFLSPYIVKTIGVEANGFITLANNFVMYASLLVITLNSMSARFITIAMCQGDERKAGEYYSSVFAGNLGIVIVMMVPVIIFIYKIDFLLDIPKELVADVRLLFIFLFINFFLSTGAPNWVVATFCKNRLYYEYIVTLITYIVRLGIIIVLFSFFEPHIYYLGIAALMVTIISLFLFYVIKNAIMPEISIKIVYMKLGRIKELVFSGMWNSINQLGAILINGLDLLLADLFLEAKIMGVLSLAKTVPTLMTSLTSQVAHTFVPSLVIDYANNELEQIKAKTKFAMKITAIIGAVPEMILVVMGREFFSLWQPTQDATYLWTISLVSMSAFAFTNGMDSMWNLFTVTNKLRTNALLVLATGIINTIIVFILVNTTNLGVYAIAGVSPILCLIRNLLYTFPYAAKSVGLKWNAFYSQVGVSILVNMIFGIVGFLATKALPINGWFDLSLNIVIMGVVGCILCCVFVLNKNEQKTIFSKLIRSSGE